MPYKWENDSFQKYCEKITLQLIAEQKKYEKEERDNDCEYCGKVNEGAVIEWKDKNGKGFPVLMHYGLWVEDQCKKCGCFTFND